MGSGIAATEERPLKEIDGSTTQVLASVVLALCMELGLGRFSRLLDQIAENETFHELTMIE